MFIVLRTCRWKNQKLNNLNGNKKYSFIIVITQIKIMNMVLRFQRQRNIKGWVFNKYKTLDVASRNMKIQMIKLQKFKISKNFQEIKYTNNAF
jgi:hypothetical protein